MMNNPMLDNVPLEQIRQEMLKMISDIMGSKDIFPECANMFCGIVYKISDLSDILLPNNEESTIKEGLTSFLQMVGFVKQKEEFVSYTIEYTEAGLGMAHHTIQGIEDRPFYFFVRENPISLYKEAIKTFQDSIPYYNEIFKLFGGNPLPQYKGYTIMPSIEDMIICFTKVSASNDQLAIGSNDDYVVLKYALLGFVSVIVTTSISAFLYPLYVDNIEATNNQYSEELNSHVNITIVDDF